jgi:hypothetical protein
MCWISSSWWSSSWGAWPSSWGVLFMRMKEFVLILFTKCTLNYNP